MKIALILVVFSSAVIGVFADTDKVKSVSVMEGDSITLHTGVTKIQGSDEIEWRFNGIRMAKIDSDSSRIEKSFRDTMQLNNITGDLKITDVTTTDSGLYKLKITSSSGSPEMTFNVTVVISSGVKSASVTEGHSVTLRSGVNGLQRDDVIRWRHQNSLVAAINNNEVRQYKDRLELDHQTGSLTITNTTTEDAGDYEVDVTIISSRYTLHKSFSVNVNETVTLVWVKEGDSVTLHPFASEIRRDGAVLWYWAKNVSITHSNARWKNTDQNNPTRDLTIRNIRRNQSGDYKVIFTDILMPSMSIHRKFHINITGVFSDETDGVKTVSVMEGDSFFLNTFVTEIQNSDLIEWLFGPQNITIAKADGKNNSIYNENDVRFKNRLNINNRTGDLSIENSNIEHSGRYQLKIISSTYTIQKSFSVTVSLSPAAPGSGLSIAGIVITVLLVFVAAAVGGLIYYHHKSSNPKRSSEVNGQNQTSNKDEETELTKPPEAV